MKKKAIEKMSLECENAKDKGYYSALVAIEEHYSELLEKDEAVAQCLLDPAKTLVGAYKRMESYVKSHQTNCISDAEGFEIMDKYFGINSVKHSEPADIIDIMDLL